MPTIAIHSRLLVPNIAAEATNDTTGSGGGGHDGLPPQYISVLALFAGFFIISVLAIVASIPYARATRSGSTNNQNVDPSNAAELDRRRQHDNPSNLFPFGASRLQGPSSHEARASLNAISPAIPFGKLQSQGDDHADKDKDKDIEAAAKKPTPPDQTGTTVVCIICLDDCQPDSAVRVLLCGHIFHAVCIDEWLLAKHHWACPICGRPYLPDAVRSPAEPRPALIRNQWVVESPPFVDVPLR